MDKVPETLSKVLDELSRRFGATGSQLWQAYVSFVRFDALANLAGVIIVAGAVLTAAAWCNNYYQRTMNPEDAHQADETNVANVVRFICLAVAAIILSLGVACNLAAIMAPQGAALYQILTHH